MATDSIWTCRAGFERDLAEELEGGRVLAAALCRGRARAEAVPTFGRQGLPIVSATGATAAECLPVVRGLVGEGHFALHLWVPDSDEGNRLTALADRLGAELRAGLGEVALRERRADRLAPGDPLVQVAVTRESQVFIGASAVSEVASTWPGGRARMKLPPGAPSRATAKVLEALTWVGHGPGPGEVCVDLGAAPGGWTFALLARRARVIAVDRAAMAPAIARDRRLTHVRGNAFEFRPDEPVDWLFCDMVERPAEVAKLLARWGREGMARLVVSNLKLPMKKRVAAVAEACRILQGGGWKGVRTRQLYHDRDEITLFAHA
ncbi:MAG: 23S rRNA (cytidine(2498)-2'-O)-methyltransferase RlmM [Myxococcales bacterium]|nr:23S rRNA (cytidine(2498)-2'-O)-methyltransferase RlmM [Myxococcales bacterium]